MSYNAETMARATLRNASISFKKSIELANNVRGMMTDRAERYLEAVAAKKQPVAFTRFTDGAGHKRGKGMAAGKYPVKAAQSFLTLVKQGVANAEGKGLGTPLKITTIIANQGARAVRYGRQRGRMGKNTSLQLVLAETEQSKRREKKAKKKAPAPAAKTPEAATPAKKPTSEKAAPEQAAKPKATEKPKPAPKAAAPAEKAKPAPAKSAAKPTPTKEPVKKDGS